MKPRLYLVALTALILCALACSLPWNQTPEAPLLEETQVSTVPEPVSTATTEVIMTEVPIEGSTEAPTTEPFACGLEMVLTTAFNVEFCYPGRYSTGFNQAMLAENPPDGELPVYGVHPDMIEFTLTGYPIDNQYHDPIVRIYPVDDFVALEPQIQTLVDDLQALLTSGATNPPSIPFVPIFNAAQMMQAQVTHLTFRNGRGVRFITQYSQAAVPISNDSAFYAFIGLTDDGNYLISATMPVTHRLFYMDNMTEPAEGWAAFSENFTTYISNMETDLLTQPPDAFFPVLSPLDEMMASFMIPPNAIP